MKIPRLTPMETQIVELVTRGLTNPEIAKKLFIEHSTVRWHLKNVFKKVGVRTRTELAVQAVAAGLVAQDKGPSPPPAGQGETQKG